MKFKAPANSNEVLENVVLPFMLETSGIRGRFVRLNEEIHTILSNHKYPELTSKLLGELLVLVAMIGSMLKLKGIISIQVQGDGAIGFISADYTDKGHLRGYAHMNNKKSVMQAQKENNTDITRLFGKGYVVITIESTDEKPYQAIVPLEGKSLTDCITGYFAQSDQMEVSIATAINKINKKWHAGGILLQKVASEGGINKKDARKIEDNWNTAKILLISATEKELIDKKIPPATILYRLFHEDGVRVFEPQKLQALCRCSRERMASALKTLSADDIEYMKIDGVITVKCHFCTRDEVFKDGDF